MASKQCCNKNILNWVNLKHVYDCLWNSGSGGISDFTSPQASLSSWSLRTTSQLHGFTYPEWILSLVQGTGWDNWADPVVLHVISHPPAWRSQGSKRERVETYLPRLGPGTPSLLSHSTRQKKSKVNANLSSRKRSSPHDEDSCKRHHQMHRCRWG